MGHRRARRVPPPQHRRGGRQGGRFVVRGGEQELLEGDWPSQRLVVIEFPDMAAARAWWSSDEYEAIKPIRRGGSTTNILLVDGV